MQENAIGSNQNVIEKYYDDLYDAINSVDYTNLATAGDEIISVFENLLKQSAKVCKDVMAYHRNNEYDRTPNILEFVLDQFKYKNLDLDTFRRIIQQLAQQKEVLKAALAQSYNDNGGNYLRLLLSEIDNTEDRSNVIGCLLGVLLNPEKPMQPMDDLFMELMIQKDIHGSTFLSILEANESLINDDVRAKIRDNVDHLNEKWIISEYNSLTKVIDDDDADAVQAELKRIAQKDPSTLLRDVMTYRGANGDEDNILMRVVQHADLDSCQLIVKQLAQRKGALEAALMQQNRDGDNCLMLALNIVDETERTKMVELLVERFIYGGYSHFNDGSLFKQLVAQKNKSGNTFLSMLEHDHKIDSVLYKKIREHMEVITGSKQRSSYNPMFDDQIFASLNSDDIQHQNINADDQSTQSDSQRQYQDYVNSICNTLRVAIIKGNNAGFADIWSTICQDKTLLREAMNYRVNNRDASNMLMIALSEGKFEMCKAMFNELAKDKDLFYNVITGKNDLGENCLYRAIHYGHTKDTREANEIVNNMISMIVDGVLAYDEDESGDLLVQLLMQKTDSGVSHLQSVKNAGFLNEDLRKKIYQAVVRNVASRIINCIKNEDSLNTIRLVWKSVLDMANSMNYDGFYSATSDILSYADEQGNNLLMLAIFNLPFEVTQFIFNELSDDEKLNVLFNMMAKTNEDGDNCLMLVFNNTAFTGTERSEIIRLVFNSCHSNKKLFLSLVTQQNNHKQSFLTMLEQNPAIIDSEARKDIYDQVAMSECLTIEKAIEEGNVNDMQAQMRALEKKPHLFKHTMLYSNSRIVRYAINNKNVEICRGLFEELFKDKQLFHDVMLQQDNDDHQNCLMRALSIHLDHSSQTSKLRSDLLRVVMDEVLAYNDDGELFMQLVTQKDKDGNSFLTLLDKYEIACDVRQEIWDNVLRLNETEVAEKYNQLMIAIGQNDSDQVKAILDEIRDSESKHLFHCIMTYNNNGRNNNTILMAAASSANVDIFESVMSVLNNSSDHQPDIPDAVDDEDNGDDVIVIMAQQSHDLLFGAMTQQDKDGNNWLLLALNSIAAGHAEAEDMINLGLDRALELVAQQDDDLFMELITQKNNKGESFLSRLLQQDPILQDDTRHKILNGVLSRYKHQIMLDIKYFKEELDSHYDHDDAEQELIAAMLSNLQEYIERLDSKDVEFDLGSDGQAQVVDKHVGELMSQITSACEKHTANNTESSSEANCFTQFIEWVKNVFAKWFKLERPAAKPLWMSQQHDHDSQKNHDRSASQKAKQDNAEPKQGICRI